MAVAHRTVQNFIGLVRRSDEPWRTLVLASFYYDVIIESKFAADESIFSSTPDLSFIFSSTPDLSILFTSEILFLEYFEFYQHSTPVVSSNQILRILEAYNN